MDTHNNVVMLDQHRNEKQKQPEQETDDLLAAADQFLDANPMREVLRLGCYFMKRADGSWFAIRPGYLAGHFPEWSQPKFRVAVTMKLQERGWAYNDVTYTFRQDLPSDMLNLLDRSGWLQPATGDHHWVFDVLMQSLGGNKTENMEHIKHVLAYKYLHPEAYTLPCLLIHGEGGVGKNLLVNHVLGIIFDGQTTSTASANVIGNFNSKVKGMAVVLMDESMAEKVNSDALKIALGNATITINEKGIAQYDADNTPLYMISSNDSEGGLYLDRSHADRRYSVMLVEQGETLDYWIARHEGWITDEMPHDQREAACHRAKQWMHDHGFALLTDRQQVACWLGHIVLTYGELPHPMPLHGVDFRRLLHIQKPIKERIVEAVFNDAGFTHIEKKVLYKAYRLLSDESGHRGKVRDHVFYAHVETWLKANKRADIGEKRERMDDDHQHMIWYSKAVDPRRCKEENSARYIDNYLPRYDSEGREIRACMRWVGPEV
jgi:uncharacterized Zn-binding protein involved in type VI secretion